MPDHRDHPRVAAQVARDADGLLGIGLVVHLQELQLAPGHASAGIDLLDRHLGGALHGLAVARGERPRQADEDGFAAAGAAGRGGEEQDARQKPRKSAV